VEDEMNKVLVTGGAGFIGSHLVEALLEKRCQITVIDDLSSGHLENLDHIKDQITFIKGDIRDVELIERAARGCDTVFHLAAIVSVPKTVLNPLESAGVNDVGTLLVFETARKMGVRRVIISSSCAVYGDDPQLPKKEIMMPRPLSPYAVHKLAGEHYASIYHKLYGLETVALRYFNVYGPRQDPSSPYSGVISIFMSKAIANSPPTIYGDGAQYRDFIFVADVVQANLLAAVSTKAPGRVFNIGSGDFVRVNQLWDKICALSGSGTEPRYETSRPGDIVESVADIDTAGGVLEFGPAYSFDRGLKATYEWYLEQQVNENKTEY